MKTYSALLFLLLSGIACAAEQPATDAPRKLTGILTAGYSYGGDTLPDVELVGGGISTLRAGTGINVSGGGIYRPVPRLGLQATFGYQFHAASHDGGTAYVKRYPLEIAPFVYLGEKARLGFGWRHNFKLKYDGRYNKSPTIEFGQSDGVYAELGVQYQPDVWFALRYIKESYKARPFDFRETRYEMGSIKADHFGFMFQHTF